MREIEFRAYIPKEHWIAQNDNCNGKWHIIDNWQNTIYTESVGFIPDKDDGIKIVQFTSLKDRKDKKIFEGDIILMKHPHKNRQYTGEIFFEDGCFCAKGFFMPHFDYCNDFREGLEYCEVIGNVYEHPELPKESLLLMANVGQIDA